MLIQIAEIYCHPSQPLELMSFVEKIYKWWFNIDGLGDKNCALCVISLSGKVYHKISEWIGRRSTTSFLLNKTVFLFFGAWQYLLLQRHNIMFQEEI